jgi:hypothetical protein
MPLDGLLMNGLLLIFIALDRLPTLTACVHDQVVQIRKCRSGSADQVVQLGLMLRPRRHQTDFHSETAHEANQ